MIHESEMLQIVGNRVGVLVEQPELGLQKASRHKFFVSQFKTVGTHVAFPPATLTPLLSSQTSGLHIAVVEQITAFAGST